MQIFDRIASGVALAAVLYLIYIFLPHLGGWKPKDVAPLCAGHGRVQQIVDVSSAFASIEHGDQVVVLCTDGTVHGKK